MIGIPQRREGSRSRGSVLRRNLLTGTTIGVIIVLGVMNGSLFLGIVVLPMETTPTGVDVMTMPVQISPASVMNPKLRLARKSDDMDRPPMDYVGPTTRPILLQPSELHLPTPILVMGLMKAGTTSIYGYFRCGLDPTTTKLSHYDCKPPLGSSTKAMYSQKIGMSCGKRIRRNLTKTRKPAFHSIDDFTLYAELDGQENNGGMTLPQWDYVQEIYEQFPTATWILNLRQPEEWLRSVDRWLDLRQRFIANPFLPDLPRGVGTEDKDMIHFYQRQAERIREFCSTHPSLSCVEVSIDSPDAGIIMEKAFGIPKVCWGNRNANNGTATWTAS